MRRSELKRTPFRHKEPSISRSEHPRAKAARCKFCKTALGERERGIHSGCVDGWYAANREKIAKRAKAKQAREAKAQRAMDRETRQGQKSVKRLKAEAQDSFNDFIRERDKDLPCVSCKTTNPPMTPGGQWDAGHFLSRGAYPELAFDEDNCHKQCKSCNAGSGKFSHKARTVAAAYEEELLIRIGPERLARLKGPHVVKPLEREDLVAIKITYRAKRKALIATPTGETT